MLDLSGFMQAAAEAAKQQETIIASLQMDISRLREEHEITLHNAIRQVENDAAEEKRRLQEQMEQSMQAFEQEIIKSAEFEIDRQCAAMCDTFEAQYKEKQECLRDKLAAECEKILQEKDEDMQRQLQSIELDMQQRLETLEGRHHLEVESLKNEVQVWAKANQDVSIESDRMISKVLSEAEERCQSLQEEVRCLRDQLQCSDIQLRDSNNNMAKLDHAFMDVAREINARHNDEIAQLSDERCRLQSLLQRAESDIASQRVELADLKSRYRVIEVKSLEQEGVIRSLHQTKTETTHRCADFQSCMQLLERQSADLKSENSSLTKAVEQKSNVIIELKAENKELSVKNASLKQQIAIQSDKVDELQNECAQLRREYTDATEQIAWLEREKRRCVQESERQKEDQLKQLTEALGVMGKKSQDKQDPVVVHLHGNDNNQNQRRSADAINECHHLRQRLLELQRSNIRLESDLVEAKQAARAHNQYVNRADVSDVQQLTQENNSLKQIITMMRAEMESVSKLSPASKEEGEAVELPHAYTLALDQQLTHMKAYLDIMLKSSRCNDNTAEIHFLRSRYKELHDVLDQVREENLRLQDAHVNSYDEFNNSAASSRERELIQSLEEVVEERDKLIHGDFSDVKPSHKHFIEQKALSEGRLVSNEKNLMSAILNERSCDDSDATHSEVGVACFGKRPPLSNQSNFRSSKNGFDGGMRPITASGRTLPSQRQPQGQSLRKPNNKTTRPHPVLGKEPQKIRNWNSKQDR